ncbi:MAG: tetratricopeptide repeat protein [Pirellulales bacterium]|nr:tetratricopeptide repeat protein [Pirellulales bacterium]
MSERTALLERFYQQYLIDQNSTSFIRQMTRKYSIGTLERLARSAARREVRRAAALSLGYVGNYESNAALGMALIDEDRGVRLVAENGIRSLWTRDGNDSQRQLLGIVMRLIASRQFAEAIDRASELLEEAPWFAEAWNQRAIAAYSLSEYESSISDCHEALEYNPYHFAAASGMGQCHLQLNDRANALECFRRALKLNPNLEGIRANIVHLERAMESE